MRRSRTLIVLAIVAFASQCAQAVTNTLVSLALVDVQAAVNAAASGDVIQLPAGTISWTNAVTITKAITLKGAGQGLTVITNAQVAGGSTGEEVLLDMTCPTSGFLRVTGITFDGNKLGNGIVLYGPTNSVGRVDHCTFKDIKTQATAWVGLMAGVQDHCIAHDCYKTFDVYAGTARMNESWTNALTLGTTNCVVIEDCVIYYDAWYPSTTIGTASCGLGGRRTFRFNRWTNYLDKTVVPIIDCHGNQELVENNYSTHRGSRQNEIYGNYAEMTGQTHYVTAWECRGGTFLLYSNTVSGENFYSTKIIYAFEEDGPGRFDWLTNYPGCDQHWIWAWANTNTYRGESYSGLEFAYPEDPAFIMVGTNVFWEPPPVTFTSTPDAGGARADFSNYTPLVYPHPMVTAQNEPTSPRRVQVNALRVGTLKGKR